MHNTNIELKARVRDLALIEAIARELGANFIGELRQTDTYFHCPTGRLKLRETDGKPAELIGYARPDDTAARACVYRLYETADPATLKALLTDTLGVRTIVRKTRQLWLWHNVRLHLDDVARLGTFFECEAVLGPGESDVGSRKRVAELREKLRIADADLIATSYGDLIEAARSVDA